jgi:hypothetical protein
MRLDLRVQNEQARENSAISKNRRRTILPMQTKVNSFFAHPKKYGTFCQSLALAFLKSHFHKIFLPNSFQKIFTTNS